MWITPESPVVPGIDRSSSTRSMLQTDDSTSSASSIGGRLENFRVGIGDAYGAFQRLPEQRMILDD